MWRIGDRVAWTDAPQRAVVLPLTGGDTTPLVLEGSAYVVWGVLAERGPLAVEELVAQLVVEFDADPARLHGDVASLLTDLRSRGVLTCV